MLIQINPGYNGFQIGYGPCSLSNEFFLEISDVAMKTIQDNAKANKTGKFRYYLGDKVEFQKLLKHVTHVICQGIALLGDNSLITTKD